MRWSANLAFLFRELPFLERVEAAARAGFGAIEFPWPGQVEPDALVAAAREHKLDVIMFNIDAGDLAQGERGYPNDPAKQTWWRERTEAAFDLAGRLRTPRLTVLAGNTVEGLDRRAMVECLSENLRWALPQAQARGITLMIEALNPSDTPRYLMPYVGQIIELIQVLGHPNLKLEFDVYHVQRAEGNLTRLLQAHTSQIEHIQVADSPDRKHPGTGELNWRYLFEQITALGHSGYIGLEYNSQPDTLAALEWLPFDQRKESTVERLFG